MSVDLNPDHDHRPRPSRPVTDIARTHRLDPRIPALVPGFDAPFFQAGLAGFSDGAMRLLARAHGAPFCVTEALLDRTLISGARGRRREDPDYLERRGEVPPGEPDRPASESAAGDVGASDEGSECGSGEEASQLSRRDHPIAGQVMGTTPHEMARGAEILVGMNYDVIDVNFACPVKKIKRACRGGHFLAEPDDAIAVLRAVREAVPSDIPTTVKLRRSYDESPEMAASFDRIFEAAYDFGYAWATVHCRTVEQKYKGPGRWPFLADLVDRYPDRLIFGSGDIWQVDDIFAMLEMTGVHAVSVARGCIGDPWIFTNARRLMRGEATAPPTVAEQRRVLLDHLEFALELHGDWLAPRFLRKFASKFALKHPDPRAVKAALVECETAGEWRAAIDRFYPSDERAPLCEGRPRATPEPRANP